ERVIARIRDERLDRKPGSPISIAQVAAALPARAGRRLVFYAGINDWQSGVLPVDGNTMLHSPHYADTIDALDHLLEAAEAGDFSVLFKPHPNLHPKNFAAAHPRLIVARESNSVECIRHADVTATILSSLAYIALCHAKPAVLLGRNTLSGTGAAYELG